MKRQPENYELEISKQPPEVFYKGVLKNCAKFTRKHLC